MKPLRAARVSEISEATASSAVAPGERVNFHIGNPVEDKRLISAYLRMALGIDIRREDLGEDETERLLEHLGWERQDEQKLRFLRRLIRRSVPYTPRGGFARGNPHGVIKAFADWLQNQQEPLSYDLGQSSGKREVVLASGGVEESLRVLFHALSGAMVERPARVFLHCCPCVPDEGAFEGLAFERLPEEEQSALHRLEQGFVRSPQVPAFLVMGRVLGEETRRSLRQLSVESPLFFLEANDAPNHLSLAREAKLIDRVVRILTPSVFALKFRRLATVFLVGNAEILRIFESVHFQLKGTPSASEIELLLYLLEHHAGEPSAELPVAGISVEPPFQGLSFSAQPSDVLAQSARRLERRLGGLVASLARQLEDRVGRVLERVEMAAERIERFNSIASPDRFAGAETGAFLDELVENVDSSEWQEELLRSFLNAFVRHHPEYRLARCVVVSGSSRTALGLLGFHCGIREVIVPDLSWSYEHCFPSVQAVPLTKEFGLDVEALIEAVGRRIGSDPDWNRAGAVVINNPHNATGRIFAEADVRRLLVWLLEHGVFVIDDLSYQDVTPSAELPRIRTARQLANELVRRGELTDLQAARVITVHSVSKTDCLAGARLAVVEMRDDELFGRFCDAQRHIRPNLGAIALTYLFYRNEAEVARAYWRVRNQVFLERTNALLEAVENLPKDRNPFGITIVPPAGSMYPLMVIDRLPQGLSLDWLASGLARQGIGVLPLSTFARTERGYEAGRKTFRLTLGGTDGADILLKKTRRVLIDLNRLIAEESSRYNLIELPAPPVHHRGTEEEKRILARWRRVEEDIVRECMRPQRQPIPELRRSESMERFSKEYVPQRLAVYRQRFEDRYRIACELMRGTLADGGKSLARHLERELFKDSLTRRLDAFRNRSYDRTVHPTQMYSIKTERCFEEIIACLIREEEVPAFAVKTASRELLEEFFARNVAISSSEESDELLLDLDALIAAENFAGMSGAGGTRSFLSFWGDWDGSNRPSGQGHRLVATILIENVRRLSRLLSLLLRTGRNIDVDPAVLAELRRLPESNRRFTQLLNDITNLTDHLEKRYRGILPFRVRPGTVRALGMKLHIARDPVTLLWQHNDRLERKMLDLRRRRREMLEYYFALNKSLRKQLFALIPALLKHLGNRTLLLEACLCRDLLQRMVITPRIQQSMVTAQDSFAIDTTVYNIHEVNEIGARYGSPGLILALQVSMSTDPEAVISLDRKMRARCELFLREHRRLELPRIQLIPLFESLEAVRSIPAYLAKIWDYALQSRRIDQDTDDRFAEIVSEVFIAGSDLSQQIGQAAGAASYGQAKHNLMLWLAEHRLVDRVRIKLGSGEPMQRQGGYYAPFSGKPAFRKSPEAQRLIARHLSEAARKSTEYATTPLMGLFTGGDLRTLQSTVSEQLRLLPVHEMARVLHHLRESQKGHRKDLLRAAESLVESRLQLRERGEQELTRLTGGTHDPVYDRFIALFTEDFRQILYGREEDVVGVHTISYFIARTIPQLRDRPTVRPALAARADRGQRILEQIAQTIPLARHGSRLRAIAHNQAQTEVLGLNQVTTGLFRALDRFMKLEFEEGDAESLVAERLLPRLPVYEMLQSLRLYHDPALTFLKRIEPAFPAGNSAFLALREDHDCIRKYTGLLQQELLRRHGLEVGHFLENGSFVPELLAALRPDLAVLLQADLFNTDFDTFIGDVGLSADGRWRTDVKTLLTIPEQIRFWRSKIWELLEEPVLQRVQSFVELALALNSLSSIEAFKHPFGPARELKLSPNLSQFFRAATAHDDMREFLAAALEYLTALSEGMIELPVVIIRSMKEVERIARIEEQALPPEKQDLLRFYMLQIARVAGENG